MPYLTSGIFCLLIKCLQSMRNAGRRWFGFLELIGSRSRFPVHRIALIIALLVGTVIFPQKGEAEGHFLWLRWITPNLNFNSEASDVFLRPREYIAIFCPSPHVKLFTPAYNIGYSINGNPYRLSVDRSFWSSAEWDWPSIFFFNITRPQIREIPVGGNISWKEHDTDVVRHISSRSFTSVIPYGGKAVLSNLPAIDVQISGWSEVHGDEGSLPSNKGLPCNIGGLFGCLPGLFRKMVRVDQKPYLNEGNDNQQSSETSQYESEKSDRIVKGLFEYQRQPLPKGFGLAVLICAGFGMAIGGLICFLLWWLG